MKPRRLSSPYSTPKISLRFQLLYYLLLLLLFYILQISSINGVVEGAEDEEAVGYGYEVKSVGFDSTGTSLIADLQLLKASSVFGSDIGILRLTAR